MFTLALTHDQRDCDGTCPCKNVPIIYSIWTAAQYGDYQVAKARINRDMTCVTKLDKYGFSALHYAAQGNHVELVKLLLDKGCPADGPNIYYSNNSNNIDNDNNNNSNTIGSGCTPLHRAAYSNSIESVQLLLDYKADINAHDTSFGDYKTPLHKASEQNHLEIVEILINSGLCNLNKIDKDNNTALHLAYKNNHMEIVNLLMHQGADIDIVNNQGFRYNELLDDNTKIICPGYPINNHDQSKTNFDGNNMIVIEDKNGDPKENEGRNEDDNFDKLQNTNSSNNSSNSSNIRFGLSCSACGVDSLSFTRKSNGLLVCMSCK